MSDNMTTTIAVSNPLTIPSIRPEFGLSCTLPPAPNECVSSPGGIRRAVSQGQQFGRYQDNEPPAVTNSSSMSLEAIAVLLSTSPDDDMMQQHRLSPPSSTISRPKEFCKSRSFPTIKPPSSHYSSSGHHKARPPVRKARSVKFADSKGLPLESVRKLTASDPFETAGGIVPQLFGDLGAIRLDKPTPIHGSSIDKKQLTTTKNIRKVSFPQPGTQPDFITKVRAQQVCLESAYVSQPRAITGTVRVMNIAYDKEVTVRWTNNKWKTFHDTNCNYCHSGSSDSTTDRFSFDVPVNNDYEDIEFAVRYKVINSEYWDSNNGVNYLITTQQH